MNNKIHGDPPPPWVHIGYAASFVLFILTGAAGHLSIMLTGESIFPHWDKIIAGSLISFAIFLGPLGWGWPLITSAHRAFTAYHAEKYHEAKEMSQPTQRPNTGQDSPNHQEPGNNA